MEAGLGLPARDSGEKANFIRFRHTHRRSAQYVTKVNANPSTLPPRCKSAMVTYDKSRSKSGPRLGAPREMRFLYPIEEETSTTINLGATTSNREHDRLVEIEAKKLNIPAKIINILRGLREYQLLFIIDDGNSMTFDSRFSYRKDGAKKLNCMEELKIRFKIMIPLIAALSDSGVIVKTVNERVEAFIGGNENNEDKKNKMYEAVDRMEARGNTPLITVLAKSFKSAFDKNIKTIAYVMTGGVLTCEHPSQSPERSILNLFDSFREEADDRFFPINLMLCTGNDEVINWTENLNSHYKNIKVTSDYFSELKKVYNAHGSCVNYTYGLYTAVSLAAPINDLLDRLDDGEKFLTVDQLEVLNGSLMTYSEYEKYKNEAYKARNKAGYYNYVAGELHPVNETKTLELNSTTLYRAGIIEDGWMISRRNFTPDNPSDSKWGCSIL